MYNELININKVYTQKITQISHGLRARIYL